MIKDVVFEQNYAKQINAQVQKIGQQAFMAGRQQGWNDLLVLAGLLQTTNTVITPEVLAEELNKFLNSQQEENNPTPPENKKPSLKLVP